MEECGAVVTREPLPEVGGDFGRLAQLFQNLVGNATKYRHPRESPRVHASVHREGGEWVVSVRDNGIGIAPEQRERIFGVFKRLHGREIPGTGIGLAVAKKIVERHGGRIWVESSLGTGSDFRFTLCRNGDGA